MPAIARNGVELHFEVAGEGTPLVMLHGFMGTLEQNLHWLPILRNYRVILPDARGHGKSAKPHDPSAYRLSERTLDVIAILDHLGFEKAHCMGYSMGGWTSLGLASEWPERLHSVVAGGVGPEAASAEASRFWREPMIEALKGGMEAYCRRIEQAEHRVMSEEERAYHLALDHEALAAQLSVEEEPDFRQSLAESAVALLLYVGDRDMHHDSAKEFCEGLQHARFLSIPGCDHNAAANPQSLPLPDIIRFLEINEVRSRMDR